MTILNLDRMWLTNTVTLDQVAATTERDRKREYAVQGEVRTYAGGRQRAVGSIGAAKTWPFTMVELSAAQVDALVTWMESGVTVFVRDHRGQSMYGTFFSVSVSENMGGPTSGTYNASITVQYVDVVEGV